MSKIPDEHVQGIYDVIAFAQKMTARQKALESLVRQKLGITESEWRAALDGVSTSLPDAPGAAGDSGRLGDLLRRLAEH